MSTLYINGQSYPFESIKREGITLLKESEHTHQSSFQLIQDWLTDKQSFLFTTSGSTGTPKPIELNRSQLETSARGTIQALTLKAADHFLVCMNTSFIGGAMLIIRALLVDANITLKEPSSNPLKLIPDNHSYTFASFAPLQLFPIIQNVYSEKERLSRFKQILVGGGILDSQLEKEIAALPVKVFHTYGMTETVSHIALREIGKQETYTKIANVQLKTDNRGCLAICCAATNNDWVQTNDVVELLDSCSFIFLGRADDVINSGGIKIWPNKIEQIIRERLTTFATNVFVYGIPDAKLGQKLIAVIETSYESSLLPSLLKSEPNLTKYEVPKQYFTLPSFEYTPTGKINKAETLKMLGLQV
jgi:O-succinylbenzoic acid--CoA ligase